MESITERYYLQSNEKDFRAIYTKYGKPLPLSIDNDKSAKIAGKFFADDIGLKDWWVEKETVKTIRNVVKIT